MLNNRWTAPLSLPRLFRGNASIHIAVRLGDLLHVELIYLHGSKRLSRDERSYVPVQMTPIGQPHLQPIEAVLPLPHFQVRADPMFKKQELPTRLSGLNKVSLRTMGFHSQVIVPLLCDFGLDRPFVAKYRRQLFAHASGNTLEIGFGTGLNLPCASSPHRHCRCGCHFEVLAGPR